MFKTKVSFWALSSRKKLKNNIYEQNYIQAVCCTDLVGDQFKDLFSQKPWITPGLALILNWRLNAIFASTEEQYKLLSLQKTSV